MKCTKCGFEFSEGIFCPECGTKYDEEEAEKIEMAKERAEKERHEKEKAELEAETLRLKNENLRIEQEMVEKKSRTYKGVVYDTIEDMLDAMKLSRANSAALTCMVLSFVTIPLVITVIGSIITLISSVTFGITALKDKTEKRIYCIIGFIVDVIMVIAIVALCIYIMTKPDSLNGVDKSTQEQIVVSQNGVINDETQDEVSTNEASQDEVSTNEASQDEINLDENSTDENKEVEIDNDTEKEKKESSKKNDKKSTKKSKEKNSEINGNEENSVNCTLRAGKYEDSWGNIIEVCYDNGVPYAVATYKYSDGTKETFQCEYMDTTTYDSVEMYDFMSSEIGPFSLYTDGENIVLENNAGETTYYPYDDNTGDYSSEEYNEYYANINSIKYISGYWEGEGVFLDVIIDFSGFDNDSVRESSGVIGSGTLSGAGVTPFTLYYIDDDVAEIATEYNSYFLVVDGGCLYFLPDLNGTVTPLLCIESYDLYES